MKEVYLVNCCRTAVGKFQGSLAKTPAPVMGGIVIKEALKRSGLKPENVDEVMFGNILTAAPGSEPRPSGLPLRLASPTPCPLTPSAWSAAPA